MGSGETASGSKTAVTENPESGENLQLCPLVKLLCSAAADENPTSEQFNATTDTNPNAVLLHGGQKRGTHQHLALSARVQA